MNQITAFVKSTMGKGHKLRGYGEIETNIFHYVTPKMILCLVVPITGIALGHETIWHYFMAGEVALNAIILTAFAIGMTKAILNNLVVYKNARFLKRMGDVIDEGKGHPEQVHELLGKLRHQGNLFDTNHMEGCIRNIERFGHPNFTDADARMIKGKLGQRIGEARKGPSFLGGLLVMMGLIGTYIGLLHTVDKVGSVMKLMGNIGGDGDAMGGFLTALSEPLQGMGMAFSASLFGIAGSVIVSIFGNFCAGAQSEFIENVSRWIDDRIPKFSSAAKDSKDQSFGKAASAEDLRTWLAGFVNLSVQSNRKMGQLVAVLAQSSQASIRSARAIDALMKSQANTHGLIEAMGASVAEFGRRASDTNGGGQMQQDISDLKASAREISSAMPALAQALHAMNTNAAAGNTAVKEGLVALGQTMRSQAGEITALSQTLRELPTMIGQMAQTQEMLLQRLESMEMGPGMRQEDAFASDLNGLSGDLNSMLEEMNSKNANLFEDMFAMDDEDGPPVGPIPKEPKDV